MTTMAEGAQTTVASFNDENQGLRELLEYNEQRAAQFRDNSFCRLISSGALDDGDKRRVFLSCVQLFSRRMQTAMFSRQALCSDPKFYPTFLKHMQEEFGHDEMLASRKDAEQSSDVVIDAGLTWFCYQMIVLDNAERAAVMHLVLETAGDDSHGLMVPALEKHIDSEFFALHAELDEGHAALGIPLLSTQHPSAYERIHDLVERSWDMLAMIMDRITQLTQEARPNRG